MMILARTGDRSERPAIGVFTVTCDDELYSGLREVELLKSV